MEHYYIIYLENIVYISNQRINVCCMMDKQGSLQSPWFRRTEAINGKNCFSTALMDRKSQSISCKENLPQEGLGNRGLEWGSAEEYMTSMCESLSSDKQKRRKLEGSYFQKGGSTEHLDFQG